MGTGRTEMGRAGAAAPAGPQAARELVFTRLFNAPRELVFKVWSEPGHVAQWWGPRGFTTTSHHMDVRPGGMWRFTMHGPDGTDYKNLIVYEEVVPPERLVYSHAGDEDTEDVRFQVAVTFAAQGGKTLLTMRGVFPTAEERQRVVEKYRADEGGNQTLDRLGEYLATQ